MSRKSGQKGNRAKKEPEPGISEPISAIGVARPLVPIVIILFSCAAIFQLPYHFPVPGPNGSQSWEFGYSNATAQILIALMLLALFGWRLVIREGRAQSLLARLLTTGQESQSCRPLLYAMGIAQTLTALLIIVWTAILPYSHYGEFTYFIQRIEATLVGRVPYRDFSFEYGPSMIGVPVFLYHLFRAKLSVETAYIATLVCHYFIGYGLLAYLVSRITPARDRVWIFTLLAIPFLNLSLGLNYTPLRFTVALAGFFAARDLYEITEANFRRRLTYLGVAAFLFPNIGFAISPEMGLALAFGLLTYFAWFIFGSERSLSLLILPVFGGLAAAACVFPHEYFDSMLSFGKGGASFPIFPTIHIVAFLSAAIWVFPALGVIATRNKSSLAPFAAGLAVLCGLFILPATGRCDFGHVYFNSVGIFLLSLGSVTWATQKWRLGIMGVFFLIFPLIDQITFWNNYQQPMRAALTVRQSLSNISFNPDNTSGLSPNVALPRIHYSKLLPVPPWLGDFPNSKVGLPLGADESVERALLLSDRLAPEYHIAPFGDLFEPSQLSRKFADLDTMQYIYIPEYYLNYLRVDPASQQQAQADADCKFMSGLLLFPISLPPVHLLFQPEFDIMRHIASRYALARQYPGGLLLKRKQ